MNVKVNDVVKFGDTVGVVMDIASIKDMAIVRVVFKDEVVRYVVRLSDLRKVD